MASFAHPHSKHRPPQANDRRWALRVESKHTGPSPVCLTGTVAGSCVPWEVREEWTKVSFMRNEPVGFQPAQRLQRPSHGIAFPHLKRNQWL